MNFGQLLFSDYTKKEIQTESEIYKANYEQIFFENNYFQSIKERSTINYIFSNCTD